MNKSKLILASSSPRRKDILEKMGLNFSVVPSDYDETLDCLKFSYEKIEDLAFNKAKSVSDSISGVEDQECFVISADTVVVLDNEILGKPIDKSDAVSMLKNLSNKEHFVVTSICLLNSKTAEYKVLSETSYVEFEDLEADLIFDYVENFNPLDKAGAYGIQELPDGFIKNVSGSFENIVGLCPIAVNKLFSMFDIQAGRDF